MSEVDYEEAAAREPEVEENPLAALVDAALAKDYNKANELFGQAISVKLDDVMDQERIKLSGQIFNGEEEEEEEDVEDLDDSEDDSEVEDTEAEDDVDDDEDNDEENSSE